MLALAGVLGACKSEAAARDATSSTLRVGFIASTDEAGASGSRGALLGAEEASRTGALLGRGFEMQSRTATSTSDAIRHAGELVDAGATALVGGFDTATCVALDSLAAHRGVVFVNVGCRDDELRARASTATFHVQASDSMYMRSLSMSREAGGRAPLLWHADLARYGAAQLNTRFVRRFGIGADASAWASWLAMKVIWEAATEAASARATLADGLLHPAAEFDGHKGEPLRFDSSTRQLRQPLFSAPMRGPSAVSRAAATDSLSTGERRALRDAFDAGLALLVVSNEGSSDVSVLNAETGGLLATVRFDERPRGVQVSRDGQRAWIALSDEAPTAQGDGDGIAELDLRNGRLTRRYPAGSDPEQFAVSGDRSMLIAANEDAGTATLLDMRDGTVRATLLVGIEPEGVALSSNGRWAYITAETSNTVTVIDIRREAVIASFLVDERPRAAAFAPDGRRAYVTNEISGTLSVVDAERHVVLESIPLAGGRARPVGVVVSPDSRTIYVANGHANSVSVLSAAESREVVVVEVGRRPWGLSLSADGRRLYVANGGSGDVSVIDTERNVMIANYPVGDRPWGVAVTR